MGREVGRGGLFVDPGGGDLGGFDDADHAPALQLGKGAGLHDLDAVAGLALVLLVMGVQHGAALDLLAVHGVRHGVLEVDLDRLVPGAGDDDGGEGLAVGAGLGHRETWVGGGLLLLGLAGEDGQATGDLLAEGAETGGILDRAGGLAQAELQELLAGLAHALLELGGGQRTEGRGGGGLVFLVLGHR